MVEVKCTACGATLQRTPMEIKRSKTKEFFCNREECSTYRSKRGDYKKNQEKVHRRNGGKGVCFKINGVIYG